MIDGLVLYEITGTKSSHPLPSPPQRICKKLSRPRKRAKLHPLDKLRQAQERRDRVLDTKVTRARSNSAGDTSRLLKVVTTNLERLTKQKDSLQKAKDAEERRNQTLESKRTKARRSTEKRTPGAVLAAQEQDRENRIRETLSQQSEGVRRGVMRQEEKRHKAAHHFAQVAYKRDRVQVPIPLVFFA